MRKNVRFAALAMALLMVLGMVGGAAAEAPKVRVALILEGAISDMSWNATAYNGLKKIEALGAEIKYVENIPASSVADAIRTFGDEGMTLFSLPPAALRMRARQRPRNTPTRSSSLSTPTWWIPTAPPLPSRMCSRAS